MQKMNFYVVLNDELPDRVVDSYDDMVALLELQPDSVAHEYVQVETKWLPGKKFMHVGEIAYLNVGKWTVPHGYATYNRPNVCACCNKSEFMQGTLCTYCTNCDECGRLLSKCRCCFNDY